MVAKWVKPPEAQWFDVPFIGDDIAKIGRIIDIWVVPCKPNAEVWVYGFFSALPTFFATLTKPELVDFNIHRHRGRPKKGKRMRFFANLIFRDAIIQIPTPRWVVFRLYEFSQRIGWYFLVADATETFLINWMSMAYRYEGCQHPTLIYSNKAQNHGLHGTYGPPHTFFINWNQISYSNMNNTVNFIRPIFTGRYRVVYDVKYEPYTNPAQSEIPFVTRMWAGSDLGQFSETEMGGGGIGYASGSYIIDYQAPGTTSIGIAYKGSQPNKFFYVTGKFQVDRVYGDEFGPDP